MESTFWHQRWENNQIAFHETEGNRFLIKHFDQLSLTGRSRIFLPLCGKTRDLHFLMSKGCHVIGVELSEIAIQQLFVELDIKPQIDSIAEFRHYHAPGIDIFVGDFFALTSVLIGKIDAVFDRAALVALPTEMRIHYCQHLIKITEKSPQLLITFEYQQDLMPGPPFSIVTDEVKQHYQSDYQLSLLESDYFPGGIKGVKSVKENVWLLT